MNFQELVLWATVGTLLNAVGYTWDSWQFWCFLTTYWAVSALSKNAGRIEGIITFLELTEQEQSIVKRALEKAKEDTQ